MIVIGAVGVVVFLGFLGLVIDVGRLYVARQQLRDVCDAAAMAGAGKLPGDPEGCRSMAFGYYVRNAGGTTPADPIVDGQYYQINGTLGVDNVRVITPYGTSGTGKAYVEARRNIGSMFMQVLGVSSVPVSAYAVGSVKLRTSTDSLLPLHDFYGDTGGKSTQSINRSRSDGQLYSVVILGNNLLLGVDQNGNRAAWTTSSQNIYVNSNNSIGLGRYGDDDYNNYGKGNVNTSPELLNPTLMSEEYLAALRERMLAFIQATDPTYYITQATAQSHVFNGDQTFRSQVVNGFYFVYGDINIDKDVVGTATFCATGKITTGETGQNLTTADTKNKILFFAGCDPSLPWSDPASYFNSPQFDPAKYSINLNDNFSTYKGLMFAPFGNILVESNTSTIQGALWGDTLSMGTNANTVTVRFDADYIPAIEPYVSLTE